MQANADKLQSLEHKLNSEKRVTTSLVASERTMKSQLTSLVASERTTKSQLQALRQDVIDLRYASNTPKIHGLVSLVLTPCYSTTSSGHPYSTDSSMDFYLGGMQLQLKATFQPGSDKLWIGWSVLNGASCKITAEISVKAGAALKYGPVTRNNSFPRENKWTWGHDHDELTKQKLRAWELEDVAIMAKIELSF
jgi:hypothetical protein